MSRINPDFDLITEINEVHEFFEGEQDRFFKEYNINLESSLTYSGITKPATDIEII
jgi:hypothetical protein